MEISTPQIISSLMSYYTEEVYGQRIVLWNKKERKDYKRNKMVHLAPVMPNDTVVNLRLRFETHTQEQDLGPLVLNERHFTLLWLWLKIFDL